MALARDALEQSDDLYEMANIRPKNSGLPMTIWVSERGRARHAPRIKVSLRHGSKMDIGNTVPVTIEDDPKVIGGRLTREDLDAVQRYILLNRDTLLDYWNGEIDTVELVGRLRRVGEA
ncbi:MAG: hypothetical protein HY423_15975 [Candidatus Lambdaproteobacteria bacterium]|nr:hypothetical protein [Candidatus Lambdaproteobacteria bacterium]